MISTKILNGRQHARNAIRLLSSSHTCYDNHKCKVLVVGGGSGGCSVAAKLCSGFSQDQIIVLEPSDVHYYQPMFTLIGGGIKRLEHSFSPTKSVLPKKAKWLKDSATKFNPDHNTVQTAKGDKIEYDYLLVAIGLKLDYHKITGLEEALSIPNGNVCSNYSPKYVERTYTALQNFKSGNAIFTFPNSPVKCPGAPQKIFYIAEHYFRKTGKRNEATMIYNTSLGVLFGVKKYADALWKIVEKRKMQVNLRTNLVEVIAKNNEAIFENMDTHEKTTMKYEILHVTPPMSTPTALSDCRSLVTETGFLDVDKDTLQHNTYKNIFGIGDCSSSPNSKTAASVAAQCKVVAKNMKLKMKGKKLTHTYDGYASCPLVTGYNSCILAEFDYNLKPMETFPFNQAKEMYSMYLMKKDIMPALYWKLMMKGLWNGPAPFRKAMSIVKFRD